MQLNLPPRLLRVALGCVLTTVLVLSTYTLLVQDYIASLPKFPSLHKNETIAAPVELVASWTTEQLEPKFAYAQYVTNMDYLCNAVINFGRLRSFGAKHDLVLIHPTEWSQGKSKGAKAIANLRAKHPEINLRPFDIVSTTKGDATWADSLTKFHSFALTEWTRVLAFDSDTLVLNTMDHYFLSPLAAVAVPRAYWLTEKDADIAKQVLGSHVMLIEPNEARYRKIIDEAVQSGEFDMEVLNHMFRDSAMILPHRRLALLTGEFRTQDHSRYLAPDVDDEWNAMGEVSRSYLVHFSDWPLPKPWKRRTKKQWEDALPECRDDDVETADRPRCANRVMWMSFYESYDMDKEKRCKVLYE